MVLARLWDTHRVEALDVADVLVNEELHLVGHASDTATARSRDERHVWAGLVCCEGRTCWIELVESVHAPDVKLEPMISIVESWQMQLLVHVQAMLRRVQTAAASSKNMVLCSHRRLLLSFLQGPDLVCFTTPSCRQRMQLFKHASSRPVGPCIRRLPMRPRCPMSPFLRRQ